MLDASVTAPPEAPATHTDRLTGPPETPFDLDMRFVGRRAVLSVTGEIDMTTAPALQEALESAAGQAFEVWLDLTAATFMDSTGIHAVARIRARLVEVDRRLVVICPSGPVLRVFNLTGLDRLLEIHPSRRAAHDAAT